MSREQLEKLAKDSEWVETFMAKVNPEGDGPLETPCWEWTGGLDKAGYGRIHVKKHGGGKGKNYFAHRVCYMIHRGYIEPEEYILHQCHNRLCCNPDHHRLGDHNDNMDDLAQSRRVAGENNHNSKLNGDEVYEVLILYHEGDADGELWTIEEIAEAFEVSKGSITDIVYGRTWKDIYEEFWGDE